MKRGHKKTVNVRRTCPLCSRISSTHRNCPEDRSELCCYSIDSLKSNSIYYSMFVKQLYLRNSKPPINMVSRYIWAGIRKRECKLLVHQNGKVGAFLHRFIVIKVGKCENMFIGLSNYSICLEFGRIGKRNLLSCLSFRYGRG